jgi:hypothetical protein
MHACGPAEIRSSQSSMIIGRSDKGFIPVVQVKWPAKWSISQLSFGGDMRPMSVCGY